jgi:SSS family solute:Na+ symporter
MSPALILSIVLSYFALLVIISFITSRDSSNFSFFLGNKKSPWFIVAFGMIGASLSGVTFISVPGWVVNSQFSYYQVVLGYILGYMVIANILMPVYYKMNLTSIYTYLENRFGFWPYKTGSVFFLISRAFGAAARLYIVATVLQITVLDNFGIPFWFTVVITIVLIWLYTFRGGIKTIIWTDTLQTTFMLLAVILTIILIIKNLDLNFSSALQTIVDSEQSRIFFFDDFKEKNYFWKHFFGGAFIALAMTGLDQDMMQKNLSCRNLSDAKKNMYWFSFTLLPVNLLFLGLGFLLMLFANKNGIAIPANTDDLFPVIATGNYLGITVGVFFMIGIIAAAYSSADSALTALTTSFVNDILSIKGKSEKEIKKLRIYTHIGFSVLLLLTILIFEQVNNRNVIDAVFTVASYTYGPLLGLFFFGLMTKRRIPDNPLIFLLAIAAPLICYFLATNSDSIFGGYQFSYELLMLNGLLTFSLLWLLSKKQLG